MQYANKCTLSNARQYYTTTHTYHCFLPGKEAAEVCIFGGVEQIKEVGAERVSVLVKDSVSRVPHQTCKVVDAKGLGQG